MLVMKKRSLLICKQGNHNRHQRKKVCRHAKTLLIVNVSKFFHAVSTNVPLTGHIVGPFFTGGSLFSFALSFLLCQEINIWLTEKHKSRYS